MPKMYGNTNEELWKDSRMVHRESSRRVAGHGRKALGRGEEVEHYARMMLPTGTFRAIMYT